VTVGLELDIYGVHVAIRAPEELWEKVAGRLRYATQLSTRAADRSVTDSATTLNLEIAEAAGGEYFVSRDGERLLKVNGEGAVDYLETQVRQQVSIRSPEKVFMHAGVVGFGDRAVVVPGLSHSGKTTLVVALLNAGASYLSDEYAVLDTGGLVHPFTKPLSIRASDGTAKDLPVQALGGVASHTALPVGLVVLSTYREGARWRPTRLSGGDGVLKLLRHTAQTRERPASSLEVLRRMVEDATVLSGERGEASELAPLLLETLAAAV
jgi:hypothetical protein